MLRNLVSRISRYGSKSFSCRVPLRSHYRIHVQIDVLRLQKCDLALSVYVNFATPSLIAAGFGRQEYLNHRAIRLGILEELLSISSVVKIKTSFLFAGYGPWMLPIPATKKSIPVATIALASSIEPPTLPMIPSSSPPINPPTFLFYGYLL